MKRRLGTKTFKSEYITGAKVAVRSLKGGIEVTYGNGHIYRFTDADDFMWNLYSNASSYYADKIFNYFYGEE